jgi:hypothetical protein
MKLNVAAEDGKPVITPCGETVRPFGKDPENTDHV